MVTILCSRISDCWVIVPLGFIFNVPIERGGLIEDQRCETNIVEMKNVKEFGWNQCKKDCDKGGIINEADGLVVAHTINGRWCCAPASTSLARAAPTGGAIGGNTSSDCATKIGVSLLVRLVSDRSISTIEWEHPETLSKVSKYLFDCSSLWRQKQEKKGVKRWRARVQRCLWRFLPASSVPSATPVTFSPSEVTD